MAGKINRIFYLSSCFFILFSTATTETNSRSSLAFTPQTSILKFQRSHVPKSTGKGFRSLHQQKLPQLAPRSKPSSQICNYINEPSTNVDTAANGHPAASCLVIVGHRTPVHQISGESATPTSEQESVSQGTTVSITVEATRTRATDIPLPTNTQPCNQYLEFCNRSYGNITHVAAHNSPFAQKKNAASNQHLGVKAQLEDGIRMLQGQTHLREGVLHFCHTSCDILDAGPVEDYLLVVTKWMKRNPFEIVTILLTNGDFIPAEEFHGPITRSGLADLAYIPPVNASKSYDKWPTLGDLIIRSKRAVLFLDYMANTTTVPWLLPQFDYIYETPFSPTDRNFPCDIQRPPEKEGPEDRMYLVNHNLNANLQLLGSSVLVPDKVDINVTNADIGHGSLGDHARLCTGIWSRAPNFLLVDFYEANNGSVFKVAADSNGVEFRPEKCCKSQNFAGRKQASKFAIIAAISLWSWMILFM